MEALSREELGSREIKLLETSKFLLKLLIAGAIFRLILFLGPGTVFLQEVLANFTVFTLNLMNLEMISQGHLIISSKESYLVTQDCLGWKSMAMFSALVFSSTDRLRDHLDTLFLGLGAIVLVNFFRVITTIYLSYMGILSFEIIHTVLWKWGLSLFVLTIWFYWLYRKK